MGILSTKCNSLKRLDGKTVVITGCSSGIGKFTAQDFYERGARVIMACRDVNKTNEAATDIKSRYSVDDSVGELIVMQLDLSSLESVRSCAETILDQESRLDLLVNNAGVFMCPLTRTREGFEMQFGTNHLGHFLFTLLLLPKIVESAPSRIVIVASKAHDVPGMDFNDLNWKNKPYSELTAYQASKLANILFAKELARRLNNNGIHDVNVYSLHPGVIRTDLQRHISTTLLMMFIAFRCCMKSIEQGSQTTIYCAVDDKCAHESGLYYADCAVAEPNKAAKDEEEAKKLWEYSLELVGLEGYEFPKKDKNEHT